jgi:hypothetical protein
MAATKSGIQVCVQCKNNISKNAAFIVCTLCEGNFHKKCSQIKSKTFDLLVCSEEDLDWICPICKSNLKNEEKNVDCENKFSGSATVRNNNDLLKQIISDQKDLKTAVDFISSQYDNVKSLIEELKYLKEENTVLKSKVSDLEMKCNRMEQYSKNFNLEISGIPQKLGENTYSIVSEVCKAVGADFSEKDIEFCHRIKQKTAVPGDHNKIEPPKIIAKLFSRQKKQEVMGKVRSHKNLVCSEIVGFSENNRVFINEHLSAYNKKLFWLARNLRSVGYKYVWVTDGTVKIRRDDNSKVVNINCIADLPKTLTCTQKISSQVSL